MKNLFPRYLHVAVVGLAALYLLVMLWPRSDAAGTMQVRAYAPVPVVGGGRFKPADSEARVALMLINHKQSYTHTANGKETTEPAIRWWLDALAEGYVNWAETHPALRVTDPLVLAHLGLTPRPSQTYFLHDMQGKGERLRNLVADVKDARPGDPGLSPLQQATLKTLAENEAPLRKLGKMRQHLKESGSFDAQVVRIENDQIIGLLGLEPRPGFRYSVVEIATARQGQGFALLKQRGDRAAAERRNKVVNPDPLNAAVLEVGNHLQHALAVYNLDKYLLVPPPKGSGSEEWLTVKEALERSYRGEDYPEAVAFEKMLQTYGSGDVDGFNASLGEYRALVEARYPDEAQTARVETVYNHFAPFMQCTGLYVVVAVLVFLSWMVFRDELTRSAFWLLALTFAVHTLALAARIYLQGRPPVTNLYSSAVFIGWAAVLLCLVLERLYPIGVGSLVGGVVGFLTGMISHHLASEGDTMVMLEAVLDTNFWLATHVVCVTLGYVATFVAGFIAIVYTVRGVLTTSLDADTAKTMVRMIYGVVCFALLLSFVGTVLGGIWADQSWGRFWGWDPKENGALLIVIMNALILHARWGGIIKDRGMVALAMVGNMATLWSWFGTNQLGIGLHAYGFNQTLAMVCTWSWVAHLGLIGLVLIPRQHWLSPPDLKVGPVPPPQPPRAERKHGRRGDKVVLKPS